MGFPTMWYVRQQRLRPACAHAQSDQSLCKSLEHSITVKLLTEQYLGFLSLKEEAAQQARLSLHLPKCNIVGNHMLRLKYLRDFQKHALKFQLNFIFSFYWLAQIGALCRYEVFSEPLLPIYLTVGT